MSFARERLVCDGESRRSTDSFGSGVPTRGRGSCRWLVIHAAAGWCHWLDRQRVAGSEVQRTDVSGNEERQVSATAVGHPPKLTGSSQSAANPRSTGQPAAPPGRGLSRPVRRCRLRCPASLLVPVRSNPTGAHQPLRRSRHQFRGSLCCSSRSPRSERQTGACIRREPSNGMAKLS
jgi:hypothetical protein